MTKIFRLRSEALEERRRELGLTTEQKLADYIGMSQAHVNRVITGRYQPGPRFIAAAVSAFGTRIDDLFEVVEVDDQ